LLTRAYQYRTDALASLLLKTTVRSTRLHAHLRVDNWPLVQSNECPGNLPFESRNRRAHEPDIYYCLHHDYDCTTTLMFVCSSDLTCHGIGQARSICAG
jgi:hypothetical protein